MGTVEEEIVAVWVDERTAFFKARESEAVGYATGSLFTRAERFERPGQMARIPYVRLFLNKGTVLELCLHSIQGVEVRRSGEGEEAG